MHDAVPSVSVLAQLSSARLELPPELLPSGCFLRVLVLPCKTGEIIFPPPPRIVRLDKRIFTRGLMQCLAHELSIKSALLCYSNTNTCVHHFRLSWKGEWDWLLWDAFSGLSVTMLCHGLNNQEWYIFVCSFIVQLVSEKQQELMQHENLLIPF